MLHIIQVGVIIKAVFAGVHSIKTVVVGEWFAYKGLLHHLQIPTLCVSVSVCVRVCAMLNCVRKLSQSKLRLFIRLRFVY